jgi:hypothetical protein
MTTPAHLRDLVAHEIGGIVVQRHGCNLAFAKIIAGLTYMQACGMSERTINEGLDVMRDLANATYLDVIVSPSQEALDQAHATISAIRQEFGADS